MERKEKKRSGALIVLLLLLVVGISVGYAALSKNLNINGTSNIGQDTKWDVHLQNLNVKSGSVTASTPASITGDTVSFAADLTTPGDFYEFTVDVTNSGTIDAKLGTTPTLPTLTAEQKKYVTYSITYDNGTALAANDTLDKNTTKTIKVRLEFKRDISELPTTDNRLVLNFSMNYIQK